MFLETWQTKLRGVPVNSHDDAMKAVEMAEEEMKQKAIEAFRHFVEDYCNESGRKDIAAESEHYLKIFNELINAKLEMNQSIKGK